MQQTIIAAKNKAEFNIATRLPVNTYAAMVITLFATALDTPSWIYRTSQKGGLSTCREGTWGAEFYEGISPLPTERVVIKHRYSAFINTDLNTVLKARNIQSVLVCGVATNVCVETTARDAYMYDYYVTMIDDCSAAYEAKLHLGTLDNMRRHFGLVASSHEIIDTWKELPPKQAQGL